MMISAKFEFEGKVFNYYRSDKELDRNYTDEPYAYFLERIPNTEEGLFEINILKKEENINTMCSLTNNGYTAIYISTEQICPDIIVSTQIEFI